MIDQRQVIQDHGRDVAQFKDGVKMIVISLLLATRSTLSMNEFAVEKFSRQSIFRHPNYMADPSQLLRDNWRFNAETASALKNGGVWNAISPCQPKNVLETADMEGFKVTNARSVCSP